MQRLIRSILCQLVAVVVLTGCLDYEEVMTIHPNLSGKAEVTIKLPEAISGKFAGVHELFAVSKVRALLEKVDGVRLESYEKGQGLRSDLKMRVVFDSLEAWNGLVAVHPQVGVLAGKFSWRKEGGNWVIERQLGDAAAGTGEATVGLADFNYVLYTTKFELPILATNSKQYNNHGQEVRYRFELKQVLDERPMMSTTVAVASPWLMIAVGVLVVLVGLWWVWGWMKKASGKRKVG